MAEPDSMSVVINGEDQVLPAALTIRELLCRLGVDERHSAVELNRELVPKARFDAVRVVAVDVLEIVTLVGGG